METQHSDAFIIGKKIYLRAVKPGDEEMISRIENHPDPRSTLFYALPTTLEQQKERIDGFLTDPNSVLFTICRNQDNTPIGETALFRIDWVGRTAIYYIGIADRENWSKGYGSESTSLMVDYAFDSLNLNRIQLHVAIENKTAVGIYEKTGFKIEGTLIEAMFHEGKYCDFYVMGIIRRDWDKISK
jgi:RimJ/RimL family protein N-acetyltransferase